VLAAPATMPAGTAAPFLTAWPKPLAAVFTYFEISLVKSAPVAAILFVVEAMVLIAWFPVLTTVLAA
jgi:hypothetical protein